MSSSDTVLFTITVNIAAAVRVDVWLMVYVGNDITMVSRVDNKYQ